MWRSRAARLGAMSEAAAVDTAEFEYLVLYDGLCGFCDSTVQWLMDRDPQARLHFAPLQGPLAAALRARHEAIPEDIDTFVFVQRRDGAEQVLLRSRAIVACCSLLEPRPGWLTLLRWVPSPLADVGYRLFARLRYRLFGTRDACRIPTPEERARFFD